MATTPIINAQLDAMNAKFEALNHLISHQNAAIDLLASDKRATLTSDINALAELIHAGELLEVMDYGDKVSFAWADGETNYTPEWNLCHVENAQLEDGESIPVADFEWDKLVPFGTQFSPSQAFFESATDLAAGTYHFTVANASADSGDNGKTYQFTIADAIPAGYQIRKTNAATASISAAGALKVYASGSSSEVVATLTVTEGDGGTSLGTTDGSGDLNHFSRINYGHNRWKTSALRQWLNSAAAAGSWWSSQEKWDVMPAYATTKAGFLHGYDASIINRMKVTKIVTGRNTVTDGGGVDETYDRIFLSSLEQMYVQPQLSSSVGSEGAYWEYYKRLLGATSPVARSQTYTRLIKRRLDNNTAQTRFLRSAYLSTASAVWYVYSGGSVNGHSAHGGYYCAPACRIGL